MAKAAIKVQVKEFENLLQSLDMIQDGTRKALENTVSDLKSRAPGWIASAVTSMYNIKKSEITPRKGGKTVKKAGSVKVRGETIETVQLVYEGRMLTPTHFGLTPKTPPPGKKYTLKMQVYKGKRETIGRYLNTRTRGGPYSERSHNILMGTGASSPDKVSHIPFQRMSRNRNDLRKFVTTSMPQMVTNEQVSQEIQSKLQDGLRDRLEHNIQRQLGTK